MLNQLSEPQGVVAKVLDEVREVCGREICKITGQECSFSNYPKLDRNQEGDKHDKRDTNR